MGGAMSKTPSARAGQVAATPEQAAYFQEHQDAYDALPKVRVWGLVYVNFDDGPGGGFKLMEAVLPLSVIEAHTVRSWPPELLSVVMPRLAGRAQAFASDGEGAEGSTYG